ncbi:MAG: 1-acyl-sn-glycerol-3-phosphate acyltransferase [Chthoniobacterales bacterium]|nr:1-acyl-sn-glycerol-3-phosphate acyltransferase [Chthoniobacterales bacterium]
MTIIYNIFYNLAKLLARIFFGLRIVHPERMLEHGPLILAVNHSSFFDPPLAGICSRRGVYYLARKTLLKWPFFGPLFPAMNVIPVERDGNDMSALREVIKKIKEGNGVVLFPEGTRSKDGNIQPARAGIGLVIAKTGAPVLPMRIFGAYDAFPKNAKTLHFPQITVVIGEPLHFAPEEIASATRETYQALSDRVMAAIADLRIA